MKPATDPTVDYKKLVRAGYDRCTVRYSEARVAEPPSELSLLTTRLATGAKVVDLGCGAGVPITRALSERFAATGVDFSTEQIRLARTNVPQAEFIESDLMEVRFGPASLDAAVALYVLFHLPRAQQRDLLRRVYNWLVAGGLFLATTGWRNEEPYTEDDFFGVTMYWTNFSHAEYIEMLDSVGFELLHDSAVGHGYSESPCRPTEMHPLVLARKPAAL